MGIRGSRKNTDAIFTWGNNPQLLDAKANTWQGTFPTVNEPLDGFEYIAPVKSYEPNSIGLYDMSGNVWEITSDFFNTNYYKTLKSKKVIFIDEIRVDELAQNLVSNPSNNITSEKWIYKNEYHEISTLTTVKPKIDRVLQGNRASRISLKFEDEIGNEPFFNISTQMQYLC